MTTSSSCSDATSIAPPALPARLIVLEGMPGAGKTTAATALAGCGRSVVGEYTDQNAATIAVAAHPGIGDDDAHQRNWLRKAGQCTALLADSPLVYADRDWLSSLSYAYTTAPGDDGILLAARAAWAERHLAAGTLLLPATYVMFDLDPAASLIRRAGRLRPGHPWNEPGALARLRGFYADPAQALRPVSPTLAAALSLPARLDICARDAPAITLNRLSALAGPA